MKDYLRNNSKWILAIFSIFLMMAWLVNPSNKDPGALADKEVIGSLGGKTVTHAALYEANQVISVFKMLNREPLVKALLHLDARQPDIHLYLLLTEASRYGLGVSQDEIQMALDYLFATQENAGRDPAVVRAEVEERLRNIALSASTDTDHIRRAIGSFLTAQKLLDLYGATTDPSLPELDRVTAEVLTRMESKVVVLDANTPPADTAAPTEAQIAEQYAAYKSLLPDRKGDRAAVNGHTYPFGYKYPHRVQVEYLAFDREALRKLPELQLGGNDYMTALGIYQADPSKFPRKVDPAATAPATQPANLTFEEAKAQILAQLLDSRVDTQIKQMADLATTLTGRAFKPAVDAAGYRVPEDGAVAVPYATVAAEIQTRFKYRPQVVSLAPQLSALPVPVVADWKDDSQLQSLKGIGSAAYVSQGTKFADFDQLAMNVRELHPGSEGNKAYQSYRLQVGVEGPLLTDASKNAYLYRVVAADPEHEPKELAEVRGDVIEDLRKRAAFEKYLGAAPALVDAAREVKKTGDVEVGGLEAAVKGRDLAVVKTDPYTSMTLEFAGNQYRPIYVPKDPAISPELTLGVFPEFAHATYRVGAQNLIAGQKAAAMKAATKPATQPGTQPATIPATTQPAMFLEQGHPVGFVASEPRLKIFVFEVVSFKAPERPAFDLARGELAKGHLQQPALDLKTSDLQIIADRLKFVPAKAFETE